MDDREAPLDGRVPRWEHHALRPAPAAATLPGPIHHQLESLCHPRLERHTALSPRPAARAGRTAPPDV